MDVCVWSTRKNMCVRTLDMDMCVWTYAREDVCTYGRVGLWVSPRGLAGRDSTREVFVP